VILPETVIYDVELSRDLPLPLTVTSAVNALAHAGEALYSPQANPAVDALALAAVAHLAGGLRRIADEPGDLGTRSDLLRGAWLAGTCLAAVGMGLHHKLCHILGGTFDLPHAQTHTVVLPHAMAHNAAAAADAMRRVAGVLGARDAPSAVFDLVRGLGGPTALRDLGLDEGDLPRADELATRALPEPAARDARGRDGTAAGRLDRLTEQVVASFAATPDPRLRHLLSDLVRRLHGFAADNDLTQQEWQYGIDFLTRTRAALQQRPPGVRAASDTLGLSSVVDVLANSRTPDTTPSAVLGPFYVPGPPELEHGADVARGAAGTPLHVDVLITDPAGRPVPDAVMDVWQSDEDGFYDVSTARPRRSRPAWAAALLRFTFRIARVDGPGR
jgi:hypothetical protein